MILRDLEVDVTLGGNDSTSSKQQEIATGDTELAIVYLVALNPVLKNTTSR